MKSHIVTTSCLFIVNAKDKSQNLFIILWHVLEICKAVGYVSKWFWACTGENILINPGGFNYLDTFYQNY